MENTLYPPLEPFATHMLDVGDGHTLYVEESGNPQGLPAVYLHGGPGSAGKAEHRQYFNPQAYRTVVFDQRACGRSTAKSLLHANTTPHLVADIETIRTHLGIEAWHVVNGSSWGSTLALAYAQAHPHAVKNLSVSAIFLADKAAADWFTQPGSLPQFFPQEFAALGNFLGNPPPQDFFTALHSALQGEDARTAATLFVRYDAVAMELNPNRDDIEAWIAEKGESLVAGARIYAHYMHRQCFLEPDQLIRNAAKISHIPTTILHGGLDLCCTPSNAHRLHDALPNSTLTMVPLCGHRSTDEMQGLRIRALDIIARG